MRTKIISIFRFTGILAFGLANIQLANSQSNGIGSGISLQFDGSVNNNVDVGDVFNDHGFPFSFEAWIRVENYAASWSGIFATENSANDHYHGFWIRMSNSGQLQIEFGDGTGSGAEYRRGRQTVNEIGLHQWIHIAVVVNSVTDIEIYLNGVEQTLFSTDGGSSMTELTYAGHSVMIGKQVNIFDSYILDAQLDELRFWEVERTETEIRENMCRKIDAATPGLIGYWRADESYSSNTVTDLTTPAEDGTILGSVPRLTSGAPIGDESAFIYPSSWSGVEVELAHSSGDLMRADSISGNPHGVHVYRVDSLPYDTIGLAVTPQHYFGVFCAKKFSTPKYEAAYYYDFGNLVINLQNEETATLFGREEGSVTEWLDEMAMPDFSADEISTDQEPLRGEYILNVELIPSVQFVAQNLALCEKFCNSYSDSSTNNPLNWYWIFEGGSPSTSTEQNPADICYSVPGLYDVTLITTNSFGNDTLFSDDLITVYPTPPIPEITQSGTVLYCTEAFFIPVAIQFR